MPAARLAAALAALAAIGAVGCTGDPGRPDPTVSAVASPTSPVARISAGSTTATPTATPTGGATSPTAAAEVVFGTGTVQVDGTEVPVSGDCDVSREFGTRPVAGLHEDVDVLLAVDNVTGDRGHDGPFAIQVRLLDSGPVAERRITSRGSREGAEVTYTGQVQVAELRDRRSLEFLDVATLHVEATQERVRGDDAPGTRQLVVDVTCPISRPG